MSEKQIISSDSVKYPPCLWLKHVVSLAHAHAHTTQVKNTEKSLEEQMEIKSNEEQKTNASF